MMVGSHITQIQGQNFVDPSNEEILTQNVESMWICQKRKFKRMFGTQGNICIESIFSKFCGVMN